MQIAISILVVILAGIYLISRLGWLGAVWFIFLVLLMQGIKERSKPKIIVSAIFVVIPFVLFGILFIEMIKAS